MKTTWRGLVMPIGVLAVIGVSVWKYLGYSKARATVDARILDYENWIKARDREMEDRGRILKELRRIGATSLGTEEEKVTASLRMSLNEMIAHFGLIESSVTSVKPTPVKNPAGAAKVAEFVRKDQKSQSSAPDFYVVAATMSAKGTLEQAMRVLATIQVQPWVHRVDGFSLKPNGKERDRVEMVVSLSSLYFADEKLRESAEPPGWRPVREAEFAAWMPIVVKNAFKEPRPAAPVIAAAPPQAPAAPSGGGPAPVAPTPPPPYDDWRVSGLAKGTGGEQLMLVNDKTREWRIVDAGQTILDATFVRCAGEFAELHIGQEKFTVKSGQKLSDRAKVP